MALGHLAPAATPPTSFVGINDAKKCIFRGEEHNVVALGRVGSRAVVGPLSSIGKSRFRARSSIGLRMNKPAVGSKMSSPQLRTVENFHSPSSPSAATAAVVEIPVTCYQIIGLNKKAEKDEIVKAVMELKASEIEEGYTMDAILSRQELLMDVRDKLLFEPEYAGNIREKILPKSPLLLPWAWLPGALLLLQEVGEEKLVLDIGRSTIPRSDAKPYIHDLLLSMALAECSIAKAAFEKNKVYQGFEALARAQCLLRNKISLGKMTLLSQIEESLEELAPVCTLELLGLPHIPENAERRRGAISALRELLRQGLDVEATCQVEDWSCFLSEALSRLLATEVVDLLPWDGLATTRKNKKSIESQNQRAVIDFNCFYMVMIAYLALGFSSKQIDLVNKAKIICECLLASEGVDLKLEDSLCSFLTGQGTEAEVVAKIQELGKGSNSAFRSLVSANEVTDTAGVKPSLELWLKDAVLSMYPDTRDCSPSLANFFKNEKKHVGSKKSNGTPQGIPSISHRPLSTGLASGQRAFEEPFQPISSSKQLGLAVQQLTQANLQSPLVSENNSNPSSDSPTVQLKRNLGASHDRDWRSWIATSGTVGKITFVAVLGCLIFATFKLSSKKVGKISQTFTWASNKVSLESVSLGQTKDTFVNANLRHARTTRSSFTVSLKKMLTALKSKLMSYPDAVQVPASSLSASLSSSMTSVFRRPMALDEAEALVKKWQAVKAEALGPTHQVQSLSEVLDASMLVQWQELADAAKTKPCFWRFVLLQLSVLRADIAADSNGEEMAEIEAFVEEAAELVDISQPKNPNYYSTYRIRYTLRRQKDESWRFCDSNIETLSK